MGRRTSDPQRKVVEDTLRDEGIDPAKYPELVNRLLIAIAHLASASNVEQIRQRVTKEVKDEEKPE